PPPAPPPPPERRFADPLAAAARSYEQGEYDRARTALEQLRDPIASGGTPLDRQDWSRLLAFVYIAFDRDDEACAVYRPGDSLDPEAISPRIRTALAGCPKLTAER
ncbi:MAG TPA: hypothetical protein VJS92_13895, partial [Candidatus Polarisedimenticolaceae bacterium]|nr:hypothetical protein [Candidatus Polarisedimenticolaceae bacterium]